MTFNQVIQTGPDEEGGDDKAVTAMGILNTIDTLLSVVEDHKEVSITVAKHAAHTHTHMHSLSLFWLKANRGATSSAEAALVCCSVLATHSSLPLTAGNTLCSLHVQWLNVAEAGTRNSPGAPCHHVCWNMGLLILEAKNSVCFTLKTFCCNTGFSHLCSSHYYKELELVQSVFIGWNHRTGEITLNSK